MKEDRKWYYIGVVIGSFIGTFLGRLIFDLLMR